MDYLRIVVRVCGKKFFGGGRVWPPQPPRHRGGWVWGVGFYRFSSAQLPNFQGKST
ncbi:mobile element protein [Microcystis aeruginosa NIES-44]|uniref:Mobile element protein n=1 Tax=Microcystis aeruginosa NIES-44 TaxID=449439 RepID=A0A0A1VRZ5_MICAE|nr:mobile element protein [Microcystis aeruginosa NIES-44]